MLRSPYNYGLHVVSRANILVQAFAILSDCARAWRSERVGIGPHGAKLRPANRREGGVFKKIPRKMIASRPGDTGAHGEEEHLNFPYAT